MKRNLLSLPTETALFFIRIYRKFISPIKPPCCRFYPTCSEYAMTAFSRYGFFKGFGMTSWRILRCNPFVKGGFDPVPEKRTVSISRYR